MDDYAAWRARALRGSAHAASPDLHHRPTTSHVDGLSTLPTYFSSSAPRSPPPPVASPSSSPFSRAPSAPTDATTQRPNIASTSVPSMESADTAAHLSEVLRDITATERGQAKAWRNVQPCVVHAIRLLAHAAQTREEHLRQLEEALRQTQECVQVLVRDREVKEERYRLDTATQAAQLEQLWNRVLLLEAKQQQQQHQQTPSGPQPSSGAAESFLSTLDARVTAVEQHLKHVNNQLPSRKSARKRSAAASPPLLPPSASSSSASSTPSSSLPAVSAHCSTRRGEEESDDVRPMPAHLSRGSRQTPPPPQAGTSSPVTRRMLEEIYRLRRQWRHFLETVPATLAENATNASSSARQMHQAHHKQKGTRQQHRVFDRHRSLSDNSENEEDYPAQHCPPDDRNGASYWDADDINSGTDEPSEGILHQPAAAAASRFNTGVLFDQKNVRGKVAPGPLPTSCRRVRWYWTADTPQTSPSLSFEPARPDGARETSARVLPWSEWHAFDGRTDCWYRLGSWATHRDALQTLRQSASQSRNAEAQCSDRFGWTSWTAALATWPHPSRFVVRHGGVYEVRLCLVLQCRSLGCSSGKADVADHLYDRSSDTSGALSLYVNGVAVVGLSERVVVHTARDVRSPRSRSNSPARRTARSPLRYTTPPEAGERRSSPPLQPSSSHSPDFCRHGRAEEAYRELQRRQVRRPCCGSGRMRTHTLTGCLFVPAGASLQVKCREVSHTTSMCEAFCELTCLL